MVWLICYTYYLRVAAHMLFLAISLSESARHLLYMLERLQVKPLPQEQECYSVQTVRYSHSLRPLLPGADIKVLLSEERDNHRSIREFPSRKSTQCLLGARGLVVLDEDLAHTVRLPAAAAWSWDLDLFQLAVLVTLLCNVLFDF